MSSWNWEKSKLIYKEGFYLDMAYPKLRNEPKQPKTTQNKPKRVKTSKINPNQAKMSQEEN